MNGNKTDFMTIASQHDDRQKIKNHIDDKISITKKDKIKVLGFHINRQNNMDSKLAVTSSEVGLNVKIKTSFALSK